VRGTGGDGGRDGVWEEVLTAFSKTFHVITSCFQHHLHTTLRGDCLPIPKTSRGLEVQVDLFLDFHLSHVF
jgi:hypothetical protein